MRATKFLYLIILWFLLACSPISTPETSAPSQRTPGLPPTWTFTPSLPPSKTPLRTATLTFTPLPSATQLPATLTNSPTSNIPTPSVTSTLTPTITTGCIVSALEDGVILQPSPLFDPYALVPTMVPSTTYQAVSIYPTYYELLLDGEPAGWVDYRLTNIEIESTCESLPTDTRKIEEFPGLCFFTPDGKEVQTYRDSTLAEPLEIISGTGNYLNLLQLEGVYCTTISQAGPSFCVRADDVRALGACENVTRSGITTTEGWLWSQPDGVAGHESVSFGREMVIYLQDKPVQGPPPPSESGDGSWYYVRIGKQQNGSYGWIWSAYFTFR
ncbi:MAG: hypothetical protein ACK2T5_00130 [Anaerolineales bacterium]